MCALSQYICELLDERLQADVVYFNFFDEIDHYILLTKPSCFVISANLIQLFQSYGIGRKQYVYQEGLKSITFSHTSVVPQGSNIGQLLFLYFINQLIDNSDC